MSYDFQLEKKLDKLAPQYSRRIKDTAFVMTSALDKYTSHFPDYTDHSVLHSLQVIDFCNRLIGDQIEMLNEDEIYILLMSCYLHDTGMGISDEDYEKFKSKIVTKEYIEAHPYEDVKSTIRDFHHEFSGAFIKKHAGLFDIPSEEHMHAIVQVSRGHRKADLYDEKEYPSDYKLPNGNTVCLPYLSAVIRLADELDIAEDRNILFESFNDDVPSFQKHHAIKHMDMFEDRFELTVDLSGLNDYVRNLVLEENQKLKAMLRDLKIVCEKRTNFRITQNDVIEKFI